jgi:hypothetical protein
MTSCDESGDTPAMAMNQNQKSDGISRERTFLRRRVEETPVSICPMQESGGFTCEEP